MRLGFDRVDEIRELDRVLNKKDRRVVADQVKDALVGIKLGGKAADVAHRIGGACAALNGGKPDEDRRFFLRIAEESPLLVISLKSLYAWK
ncbi:Uncharacterised protein [Klebsiella michiganensis]|nr:Uncharacterised protein [Klebsiella michiganensis]